MGQRSRNAHNCSRRNFQIVHFLNLKAERLQWNSAGSGRRIALPPKFKMRNNPKSFSDDEVAAPEWPGNQGMQLRTADKLHPRQQNWAVELGAEKDPIGG